jgi:hypothetical protein
MVKVAVGPSVGGVRPGSVSEGVRVGPGGTKKGSPRTSVVELPMQLAFWSCATLTPYARLKR